MNPLNPSPTPFDICWRMFGIHVRVNPGFWLFNALFGCLSGFVFLDGKFEWNRLIHGELEWKLLAAWVVSTFIAVLFHELGHVVVGRLCGQKGNIILHSFGGAAVGQYQLTRPWQQILIALAGPAAGLSLLGIVWVLVKPAQIELFGMTIPCPRLINKIDGPQNLWWLWYGVHFLMLQCFLWNLLNLIPVIPMDGGQVVRAAFRGYTSPAGLRVALVISIAVASVVCVCSFLAWGNPDMYPAIPREAVLMPVRGKLDPTFTAIFFALLGVRNLVMLITARRQVFTPDTDEKETDLEEHEREERRYQRERERELDPHRDRTR